MKSKLDFLKEQEIHQVYIGGIVYEMVKVSQAEKAMERYAKQTDESANNNKSSSDMEKLNEILKDLEQGYISADNAEGQILSLFSVSGQSESEL